MKKLFLISVLCLASTAISLAQIKVIANGNVGIGTSSPTGKLAITQTATSGGALKGIVYTGAFNTNQTQYAEIPSLTLNTTGRQWAQGSIVSQREVLITQPTYSFVGASLIGTAATVAIAGAPIKSTNATITNTYALLIQNTNSVIAATNSYGLSVNAPTGATNNYAATFLGGNVGIGTTSPPELLTVGSGNFFRVTSLGYVRSVSGAQANPTYSFTNSTNSGMFSSGVNNMNFSTGGYERMRINGDGDVAIGETSPLYGDRLTVKGANNERGIFLSTYHNAGGGHSMTTNVNQPGTVNDVVYYNSGVRFYVTGDGLACSERGFYTWSDVSLKENINTITDPLQKVLALRGVTYNLIKESLLDASDSSTYISPDPNPVQMGLIAQEVETVIPEVVTNMPNGKKAIAYQNLVGLLVEAIKSQQITIREQENRINTIETDLANCCQVISPVDNKSLQLPNGTNNNPDGASGSPALYQNVPNPFKEKTTIRYYLPNESVAASMLIFDMQGKLIKTYNINTTGNGNIEINAGILQPGMYMYSLIANGKEVDTKKMILTD